jgi:hypothetical protein
MVLFSGNVEKKQRDGGWYSTGLCHEKINFRCQRGKLNSEGFSAKILSPGFALRDGFQHVGSLLKEFSHVGGEKASFRQSA